MDNGQGTSGPVSRQLRDNKNRSFLMMFKRINFAFITSMYATAGVILFYVLFKSFGVIEKRSFDLRPVAMPFPISLSSGWKIQPVVSRDEWKDFSLTHNLEYADQVQGLYKLKKKFRLGITYQNPAIVLGKIPDIHRVYLNGVFIGGSDDSTDLNYYSFDRKVLNKKGENEIVVEIESRSNLNPGITLLPKVGAFLDELSEVQMAVRKYQVEYQIFGSLYFGILFLCFAASVLFVFMRRSKVRPFYSSLIVLLGLIHLTHYNPWILNHFDYSFLQWLKIMPLTLTPMFLFSSYLNLNQNYRLEMVNNFFAFVYAISTMLVFNVSDVVPNEFIFVFDRVALIAVCSSTLSFSYVLKEIFFQSKIKKRKKSEVFNFFNQLYFTCGLLSILSLCSAMKTNSYNFWLNTDILNFSSSMSFALPFIYFVPYFILNIFDIWQIRKMKVSEMQRNQMIIDTLRIFKSSKDSSKTISTIQSNYCRYLNAKKSNFYIFQGYDPSQAVKFKYEKGQEQIFWEHCDVHDGNYEVLSNVIKGKLSLNLKTTILIPLISGQEILGILSFSEKDSPGNFTHSDLNNATEVSASLALILDSGLWHERIARLQKLSFVA